VTNLTNSTCREDGKRKVQQKAELISQERGIIRFTTSKISPLAKSLEENM